MKKNLFSVLVIGLLLTSSFSFANKALEVYISDIELLLNGESVNKEVIIIGESSYLPVRAISELLGVEVGWDEVTETISLTTAEEIEGSMILLKEKMRSVSASRDRLEAENKELKEILLRNGIQVPAEKTIEKKLNDYNTSYISKTGSEFIEILTGIDEEEKRQRDILGNQVDSYTILSVWGYPGRTESLGINYVANGQYDKFKATLSPYNIDKVAIDRDFVLYVDGIESYRKNFTDQSLPEDITVDIHGGKIITLSLEVSGNSTGGFMLADPRFVAEESK